jgi:uncharacterized membrane protein YhhN
MQVNFMLSHNTGRGRYPILFVITKVLLLPLIGLIWNQITTDFDRRVIAFVILSWMGDVFLFAHIHKDFFQWTLALIGSIGFLLAHFTMISYFRIKLSQVPWWAPLFAIPSACLCVRLLPRLNCGGVSQKFAFVYYFVLQAAFITAVMRAGSIAVSHPSYLLCAIGYFWSVISDSILLAREFGVVKKEYRCETMGTYAIAQTMIVVGCGLSKWQPNS